MAGLGDNQFTASTIAFALVLMILMSMAINVFCPTVAMSVSEEELLEGYEDFTGTSPSSTTVTWVLTGIYTPYEGGAYGYTDDNWLYGSMIRNNYTPTQYRDTTQSYSVSWDSGSNLYRYNANSSDYNATRGTGHAQGDLYTSVSMDTAQKSSIFFVESQKETQDNYFYYKYNGYRYAFQPPANYSVKDADGNVKMVSSNSTSLSLIWYEYYSLGSGISGQLVLSGSDSGVAYLTSAQIIQAYNSSTSTAKFNMTFNGVDMGILIKIDAYYLSNGYTIEECYNNGYWSLMVTSQASNSDIYVNSDFALNPATLLTTILNILTFNYEDYGINDTLGAVCTVVVVIPLYAGLIGIFSRDIWMSVIGVGLLAGLQTLGFFLL